MTAGIRSTSLPLGALVEVIGHSDVGDGTRAVGRQAIGDFVNHLLGLAGMTPSELASLSAQLTAEIETRTTQLSNLTRTTAGIDMRTGSLESGKVTSDRLIALLRTDLSHLYDVVGILDPKVAQARQDALNLYAAVADLYGDVHRLGADTASREALVAVGARLRVMQGGGRPGILPDAFTFKVGTDGIADLAGPRTTLPGLPAELIATGDYGDVARIRGAGLIGMRAAIAIETGRLYRPRAVVQRRTNPSDPSGDAVAILVLQLDQGLNLIGTVTVRQFTALRSTDGRQEVETTMSRSATTGPVLSLDPRTRFAVGAVLIYGLDGVTDVEMIDIQDVSDAVLLPVPAANYEARIGAIESKDYDGRLSVLESAVTAPISVPYATKAAAQGAAIPESAQVVELMGAVEAGDGGGGLYARVAGAATVEDDTFVSHGVTWRRVDLSDAVMTGMIERWWSRRAKTPPTRSGAIWDNGGTWQVTP